MLDAATGVALCTAQYCYRLSTDWALHRVRRRLTYQSLATLWSRPLSLRIYS